MILTPLQKLPNNVGDLGKIIVATSFERLPKVQKIAKSVHTEYEPSSPVSFCAPNFPCLKFYSEPNYNNYIQ